MAKKEVATQETRKNTTESRGRTDAPFHEVLAAQP